MVYASTEQSTKQKLQNTALDLFSREGYDKTSIDAIVKKAGVSKGAFYHYFTTKEEVLEGILTNFAEEINVLTERIVQNPKLNAQEKLNQAIVTIQDYKFANLEELLKVDKFLRQGNILDLKLTHELFEKIVESVSQTFEKIIKQGVKEGNFKTDYPKEIFELIILLAFYTRSAIVKLSLDFKKYPENLNVIEERLNFIEEVITRVLGAKPGSVNIGRQKISGLYKKYGEKLK